MRKYLIVILIVAFLVGGCSPSGAELLATEQAGMEQTQLVIPIETSAPTKTPILTALPADVTDEKGVEMVLVPEGEFTMGSDIGPFNEQPVRQVFLDTYYIDKFEVTNVQYKVCVEEGVCEQPD